LGLLVYLKCGELDLCSSEAVHKVESIANQETEETL
jgi:hypothetical protein